MEELFSVQCHCITDEFDPPFASIYIYLSYRLTHMQQLNHCTLSGAVKSCMKESVEF